MKTLLSLTEYSTFVPEKEKFYSGGRMTEL